MQRYELWACVDCVVALANGEYPEDTERARAVKGGESFWYREGYVLSVGDETREFSTAQCDVCSSHLGGSRHQVIADRNY